MRKIFKRGIAIIMSLALISGIGIMTNNKVKAEGEIETPQPTTTVIHDPVQPPIQMNPSSFKSQYACNVGESITLGIEGIEIDWNKYTVKWVVYTFGDHYYYDDNGNYHYGHYYVEEFADLGTSYTIQKVEEKDFTNWFSSGSSIYSAEIYNSEGKREYQLTFNLHNKAEYIRLEGSYSNGFLKEGDSVTFSVEAYDWDGNKVDLSSNEYSLSWYKGENSNDGDEREKIEGETGLSYTVDKIEAKYLMNWADDFDFCPYYYFELCKEEQVIAGKKFILFDIDTAIDAEYDNIYKASVGDSVTLSPEVRDPDGNLIDLSDSKYSFKWYKVGKSWDDRTQLESTGRSYTINKVQKSDFSTKEEDWYSGNYYIMDIYVNGKYVTRAYSYLCESDSSKPIESTTSEQPTTIKVSEQPTSSEQPTTPTSAKVTAPTKAKITKVNTKKKSAKKIKLSLKKISKVKGYQVAVYTSNKTAKNDKNAKKALVKKYVKTVSVTISSKKLKNKKKLYIKARAYVLHGKTKVYGNWSTVKQVKIKK